MNTIINDPNFELNNNWEFLRTPVKDFVKFEYKKLQTFVSAMGLPSNLKRKQLLAIIVAKKMGKDNMIPAILKEVTRQRNQRRKVVRDVCRLNYANRLFPPKFAPIPPQVISDKASPIAPTRIPQYFNLQPVNLTQARATLDYQPCFGFNSLNLVENARNFNMEKHNQTGSSKSRCETVTSIDYIESTPDISFYNQPSTSARPEPVLYEYFYDISNGKKYSTMTTDTVTTTRGILHMSPETTTTPWYHQSLSSAMKYGSPYEPNNMLPQSSSQSAGQIAPGRINPEQTTQEPNTENGGNMEEDVIDMTLKEGNLDQILDLVMGDENENSDNKSPENKSNDGANLDTNLELDDNTTMSSVDSNPGSDLPNSVQEMYLLYYAQLANRALWPLKRTVINHGNINSFIFDCLSALNSDTSISFSPFLGGIPHSFENYSIYRPKSCIYNNPYQRNQQQNSPDYCLLQPESAVSFGVPQMYYRARNLTSNYNPAVALKNYMYQVNQQEDSSRFALAAPQADYSIVLPNQKGAEDKPQSSNNYVDLQPKRKKIEEPCNIRATIPLISVEEEASARNSLGDNPQSIDINIQDPSKGIYQAEHESQCLTTKISCPFIHTLCNWYENTPLMSKHIREMHSEKIVGKKSAQYHINFAQLEMLRDRGVKIIQEHENRLCYISLCYYNDYIFIAIQELCESIEQHNEKINARLILNHTSGNRTWVGQVNSMIYPLSFLWRQDLALAVPARYLKCFPAKSFRLQVDIAI